MKKKLGLGLVAVSALTLCAASAEASVTRDANGTYLWQSTTVKSANGTVLRVIGNATDFQYGWPYVSATGRYGGGDTADGRMTAKNRAISKATLCASAFYAHGLFETRPVSGGSYWSYYCGIAPTDTDIRVMATATAYFGFEDIVRAQWCPTARQIAAQNNQSGPVYLSGTVRLWGDASGTEADTVKVLGSYNALACY